VRSCGAPSQNCIRQPRDNSIGGGNHRRQEPVRHIHPQACIMAQVDHSPSLLVLFTAARGFMVRSHFTCQPGSARLHPLWPRGPYSGCKCSSTTLFRARTWSLLPRRVGVETVVIGDSMPQMRGDTTVRQAMHLASEWNFCLTEPAQWHSRTTRRTFGQELQQAIRSPNRCDLAASGRRTTGSNSSEPCVPAVRVAGLPAARGHVFYCHLEPRYRD